MEWLCELMGTKFYEKSATASATDLIKGMVGGGAAHRASALKSVLRDSR